MLLLIKAGGPAALPEWQHHFARHAPALDVRAWDDPTVDPAHVDFVLVWEPPAGWLARFPNLKLILSAAAGVDHIICDPLLPPDIPIIRMVTDETAQRMGDYVCMAALNLIRQMPAIIEAQRDRNWRSELLGATAEETTVGVMGLGELGKTTAVRLARFGFQVAGWSRTSKAIDGVRSWSGDAQFESFLSHSQILVNLLPPTPQTQHILNAASMRKLPTGAGLINVGRSSHLDHTALIELLDEGHLSAAFLDVFDDEPLSDDSPLWSHARIVVTPHVASTASKGARAREAVNSIDAFNTGIHPLPRCFDRHSGY